MALTKTAAAQKAAMDPKIAKALAGFDELAAQLESKGKTKVAFMVDQARAQVENEYNAYWTKTAAAKTTSKPAAAPTKGKPTTATTKVTAKTLKEGQILKSELREMKAIERELRGEGKTAKADELRGWRKKAEVDMDVIDDTASPETTDDLALPEDDTTDGIPDAGDEEADPDLDTDAAADLDPGLDDEASEDGDDVGMSTDVGAGTDLADKVASTLKSLQRTAKKYLAEAGSEESESGAEEDSEVTVSGDDVDMSEDSEVPPADKMAKAKVASKATKPASKPAPKTKAEKTGSAVRSALWKIAEEIEAEEGVAAPAESARIAAAKKAIAILRDAKDFRGARALEAELLG